MITNGFCAFSPTSTKGKWIFTIQTLILSFVPIVILLAQNGYSFYYMMKQKEQVMHKADLVNISKFCKPFFIYLGPTGTIVFPIIIFDVFQVKDAMGLAQFAMALQWERAAVSLAVFLDARSGKTTDLTKEYGRTDTALRSVQWRNFGTEKVFENPLRFQIRIDDFR